MARTVQTHEGEVAVGLDLANLLALVLALGDLKILQGGSGELLLAGPFQSLGPGLVAQPVADEVGVTGVDQHRDLLQKAGDHAEVRLHPVTVELEVTVDVEVARVIAVDLGANRFANLALAQVFTGVAHGAVAEVARVLTVATDIVGIPASALVRSDEGVVTVDGSRNAQEDALGAVAPLDHGLAAGQSIVHGPALRLIQDSWVATITTGHGAVVFILRETVGETVTDQDRLEVDVPLLVGQDFGGEDRNVVASVRLSGNMEVLLRILGELLEEEGEQGVDVLASSNRVTDGRATVGVTDVNGLVKENDGSIGVPGVRVVDRFDLLIDEAGS